MISHATFPVLCGYRLRDHWHTEGAVMVFVSRIDDLRSALKFAMMEKARLGWFSGHMAGYEFMWYRTRDYPNK